MIGIPNFMGFRGKGGIPIFVFPTRSYLYGWGRNASQQIGTTIPSAVNVTVPSLVGAFTYDWRSIYTGDSHALAIRNDNSMWVWGGNGTALGLGDTQSRSFPVRLGTTNDWSKARGGNAFSAGIRTNGTLWTWGTNTSGQLGLGNLTNRSSPVQVGSDTNWESASPGYNHTVSVKTNGTLWAWGVNGQGQLGLNDTTSRSSPVQIGTGTTGDWSGSLISVGREISFAIKANGTLWAWGRNNYGQLGLNNTTSRSSPVQIGTGTTGDWSIVSAGSFHCVGIKANGTLWAWGRNNYGQLGLDDTTNRSSPVQVGTGVTGNWVNASCFGNTTIAQTANGELWTCGNNQSDQLGIGMKRLYSRPVQIGSGITGDWASIHPSINHTMAIKTNGTLWAWGINNSGQLGLMDTTNRSSPVQVGSGSTGDWLQVYSGGAHTIAKKTNGTLWGWGVNVQGQVGNSSSLFGISSPVQIGSGSTGDWFKVGLNGGYHTIAIRTDGTLWAWGRNSSGQLGVNNTTNYSSPVQIGTDANWQEVSAGRDSSFAIKTNGTMWSWGTNTYGQMGIGDLASFSFSSPVQIGSGTTGDWSKVYARENLCHAIKTNGTLWAWGWNAYGQHGSGNTTNRSSPVQVGTGITGDWLRVGIGGGKYSVQAIKTNGTLWTWGRNNVGQLGNDRAGSTLSISSPIQVGTYTNWSMVGGGPVSPGDRIHALRSDGTLWGWGARSYGRMGIPPGNLYRTLQLINGLTGNIQIGSNNTGEGVFFVKKTLPSISNYYRMFVWGNQRSANQNLGTNDTGHESVPVQITSTKSWKFVSCGTNHCHAIRANGSMVGWGTNSSGCLGNYNSTTPVSPVTVNTKMDWIKASQGPFHTIALDSSKTLWSVGNTTNGTLGLNGKYNATGVFTKIDPGATAEWSDISVANQALAIKTTGTLWGWGLNTNGELGLGDLTNRSSPVQIGSGPTGDWSMVSTGSLFSVGLKTNGTLWSWGSNLSGRLGSGDLTNRSSPIQIGTDTNWVSVDCHLGQHTLALKSNGTLWTWGLNNYGRLGVGDTTNRSSPVQIGTGTTGDWAKISCNNELSFAIKTNGTLWAWGRNRFASLGIGNNAELNDIPIRIGTGNNWAFASTGRGHGVAITTSGALWAWGLNSSGQLGLSNNTTISSPVQVGSDTDWVYAKGAYQTIALKTNGTIWAWGANGNGQLGLGNTTVRNSPVQIGTDNDWQSIENSHILTQSRSFAIKTNGTLWGWGTNTSGQLGLNDVTNRSSPVQVGTDTNWSIVRSGAYHTLAIKTTGTLWAWGRNNYGQHGTNNTTNTSSPVQVGTDANWSKISGGSDRSFAIKTTGTLWAWGNNISGRLGLNNTTSRSSPVQIGSDTDWASVASGFNSTLATKTNGTLWGWGYNLYGQLGVGNLTERSSPVQIGTDSNWASVSCSSNHTIAVKTDGSIWSWGSTTDGRCGLVPLISSVSSPVQIGSSTNWYQVSAGYRMGAAILKYKP